MKAKKVLILVSTLLLITFALMGCGGASEEKSEEEVKLDLSIAEREGAIGKSTKEFTELTKAKPNNVRNDVTKKWRKITIEKSTNITEYLLSYSNLHITDDTTVHIIFNFSTNTTTMINDFGSYLDVRIYEYAEKEEHNAKKIPGGMLLSGYAIYKDNGDIVKLD